MTQDILATRRGASLELAFNRPARKNALTNAMYEALAAGLAEAERDPRVRAVVFHPRDPNIAWVGSDGGVVRNDGTFTSITSRCGQLFGSAAQ